MANDGRVLINPEILAASDYRAAPIESKISLRPGEEMTVADLLRGDYKQSEYGRVILPFTVLRRLDCVLEATKPAVLKEFDAKTKAGLNPEHFLLRKAGQSFYNTSPLDLVKLLGDQDNIRRNLHDYVQAFSPAARDIFERFDFATQVERLSKANLLYLVTEKFANIDLHPKAVSNAQMGAVFEELIRKFAESANDTAGEFFTPRDVVRLATTLVFGADYILGFEGSRREDL